MAYNPLMRPVELPTVNGTYQELEESVPRVVKKVNDLPLQQIATHLDRDLDDLHLSLGEINGQVLPRAVNTLSTLNSALDSAGQTLGEDSPLRRNITETLANATETLRAVRELADYLDRHPDALLRGRRPQEIKKRPTDTISEVKP